MEWHAMLKLVGISEMKYHPFMWHSKYADTLTLLNGDCDEKGLAKAVEEG